ncbi:MAG: hypothetical protein WDW36_000492 [Sanguina aurantia]
MIANTATSLQVRNLRRVVADRPVISDISFDLGPGEILFIRGPSGVGKTLLLRCIATLDPIQGGTLSFHNKSPADIGYPQWRAQITYLCQTRVNFKGTPAEFYYQAQQFAAQKGRPRGDLPSLVHDLGLEQAVLNQNWSELSGGQAQRVALAIAVALRPSVLLLDEPTSACDIVSAQRVESVLRSSGAAIIWVTHDSEQPLRVGGRVLELPLGSQSVIAPPPAGISSVPEGLYMPPDLLQPVK